MTWILVLLLLLCALYLLFLYGIFRFVFWNSDDRKKKGPSLPKGPGYDSWREDMAALVGLMEEQVPTEQIRIMAEDGTILCGRYYAGEEDAPVEILFHGYRGGAVRDMCGAHKIAREHGIGTILVDERAHGESGGNVTTFGIRERRDVLSWARYGPDGGRGASSGECLRHRCGLSLFESRSDHPDCHEGHARLLPLAVGCAVCAALRALLPDTELGALGGSEHRSSHSPDPRGGR